MASRQDIDKIFVYLSLAFPAFQAKPETVDVYADLLSDLDTETLMTAARHVATTNKFFPSVSEIRGAAFELVARANGAPAAADAWDEVMREMQRVAGHYGTPCFSHAIIQRAIDGLGGWTRVCMSEEYMADRAHFLRIYDDLLRREEADARMLPEVRLLIHKLAEGKRVKALPGKETP